MTIFLGFLRHILELEAIPDYPTVVARSFQAHITSHNYGADQIRFLRSVQEVFLQKRKLAEAPAQIKDLIAMTERIAA